jgi:hypothetical protein
MFNGRRPARKAGGAVGREITKRTQFLPTGGKMLSANRGNRRSALLSTGP